MNFQPCLIGPGDKVFITPEGFKHFMALGAVRTLQDAQKLLGRLTVKSIDPSTHSLRLEEIEGKCRVEHIRRQLEPAPTAPATISVLPDLTMAGKNALDLIPHHNVLKCVQPMVIGRMPMGTKGGNSVVFVILENPADGKTIIAETTMKLFLEAAAKLRAFDDPKGN
jgi:hypothetical protein